MSANSWNLGGRLCCLCIVLVPLALARPVEAKPVLTLLPNNTSATAVNDSGVVVGREKPGMAFVRTPDGRMTRFEVVAAAPPSATVPTSVNNSGVATGYYMDYHYVMHGFVRDADGAITIFDAPKALLARTYGTFPSGINAQGVITGYYSDRKNGLPHGFVRAVDGTITSFDVPNAFQTFALGVNDKGETAGFWLDTYEHGFVRSAGGKITKFDVPGGTLGTRAMAINGSGTVTGYYKDNLLEVHSYIRQRDGQFTTFDAPGTTTLAFAISADGTVAGCERANGERPGFVRHRNGHMRAISLPETAIYPLGINTNGVVVGYLTQKDTQYGFIWTP